MSRGRVIYIGPFLLPDKNAAAHRVITIGKMLKTLGYDVDYINSSPYNKVSVCKKLEYFGFKYLEYNLSNSMKNKINNLYDIKRFKEYIEKYDDIRGVILYNFSSLSMARLQLICKRKNIKCIGDITEWYGTKGQKIQNKIIHSIDTFLRMRIFYKKMDGNIVISDYLENYYLKHTPIINIPPLVDLYEKKWEKNNNKLSVKKVYKLIYAGQPSSEKERLDLLVQAITRLSKRYSVELEIIGITKNEFMNMYYFKEELIGKCINFSGRISHEKVIEKVKDADYSVIIREKNRVTTAGFPTKFVESISCGTPVITTDNSCLNKYLCYGKNGCLISVEKMELELENILKNKDSISVEKEKFDYVNYIKDMEIFLKKINL